MFCYHSIGSDALRPPRFTAAIEKKCASGRVDSSSLQTYHNGRGLGRVFEVSSSSCRVCSRNSSPPEGAGGVCMVLSLQVVLLL